MDLAALGKATFRGPAEFDGATFGHDATFSKATFRHALFRRTTFSGRALFDGAAFDGISRRPQDDRRVIRGKGPLAAVQKFRASPVRGQTK